MSVSSYGGGISAARTAFLRALLTSTALATIARSRENNKIATPRKKSMTQLMLSSESF